MGWVPAALRSAAQMEAACDDDVGVGEGDGASMTSTRTRRSAMTVLKPRRPSMLTSLLRVGSWPEPLLLSRVKHNFVGAILAAGPAGVEDPQRIDLAHR